MNAPIRIFGARQNNLKNLDLTIRTGELLVVTGVSGSGKLTLLGQTHPVKLNAVRFNCYQNKRLDREVCGGDFRADLQRSQWGMGFGLPGIPDAVRLQIEIEGVPQ